MKKILGALFAFAVLALAAPHLPRMSGRRSKTRRTGRRIAPATRGKRPTRPRTPPTKVMK
jgi:hypothetical protein